MKKTDRLHSKPGFTVVELLTAIIIIGILAGTMMLVSMSATQKAEATRISGEIRSMKAAALFYYNDEDKWPAWEYSSGTYTKETKKYLEREPIFRNYWLGVLSSGDRAAVVVAGSSLDQGVRKHLARMATEMGYYETSNPLSIPASSSLDYYEQNDDNLLCFIERN